MKREYIKPQIHVVDIEQENIMAGSTTMDPDDVFGSKGFIFEDDEEDDNIYN